MPKLFDHEISEDAKCHHQFKKFGKKVQVENQLERQKQKSEILEKIKLLKKKVSLDLLIQRVQMA